MPSQPPIAEAVERLKAVFAEVPGTHLTVAEASRLSGLDVEQCEPILDALVTAAFLTRGRDGRFRRLSD